jgi:hypothetical protein
MGALEWSRGKSPNALKGKRGRRRKRRRRRSEEKI